MIEKVSTEKAREKCFAIVRNHLQCVQIPLSISFAINSEGFSGEKEAERESGFCPSLNCPRRDVSGEDKINYARQYSDTFSFIPELFSLFQLS